MLQPSRRPIEFQPAQTGTDLKKAIGKNHSPLRKNKKQLSEFVRKRGNTIRWGSFMGNVRMQIAHPQPRQLLLDHCHALTQTGLHEIRTTVGDKSNEVIPNGGGVTHAEVKNWVRRDEFPIPKKTIQNKEGRIDSHFFFDKQNRFVCSLHVIYQKNPEGTGDSLRPFVWIDVANTVSTQKLDELFNRKK